MPRKTQSYNVAALVDTTTSWGRNLVRGINNYSRNHGQWLLWIQSGGRDDAILPPPQWQGDGIIARLAKKEIAKQVAAEKCKAVVNVSAAEVAGIDFPRVAIDQLAASRLAAQYFLDRGFVHFAYFGPKKSLLLDQHYQGFAERVSSVAAECERFKTTDILSSNKDLGWKHRQKRLLLWLQKLPKPVGIVAWNAELGRELVFACRQSNLLVPEQVAVLVVDDDLLCEACTPSLSAIRLNSQKVGYESAALLDQLMRGEKPASTSIPIQPTSVITRESTDTLAMDNAELAQAIAFIRQNAANPIQVKDVLDAVPMSRRLLERHFQKALNRSPAQEIRRVHVERAKQLLLETDLQIPQIAEASGFGSPEHFARYFKLQTGLSPLKFRSTMQGR